MNKFAITAVLTLMTLMCSDASAQWEIVGSGSKHVTASTKAQATFEALLEASNDADIELQQNLNRSTKGLPYYIEKEEYEVDFHGPHQLPNGDWTVIVAVRIKVTVVFWFEVH